MNIEVLKKILINDKRDVFIGGLFIFIITTPLSYYFLINSNSLIYTILSVILLVIGFAAILRSIIGYLKIKNSKNDILNAIRNFDKSYFIWIYHSCIKVAKGKELYDKNCTVELVNKSGKKYLFNVKDIEQAKSVVEFLASQFPEALIGEDVHNREQIETRLNKKIY